MGVHYMAKKKPVAEFSSNYFKDLSTKRSNDFAIECIISKARSPLSPQHLFCTIFAKTQNLGKVNRYDTIHSTYKYRNSVETF